jgi:hypothetical protein
VGHGEFGDGPRLLKDRNGTGSQNLEVTHTVKPSLLLGVSILGLGILLQVCVLVFKRIRLTWNDVTDFLGLGGPHRKDARRRKAEADWVKHF